MTATSQATYARTAVIALDELTPFPGNAKRGDVSAILSSLRRNGQYKSLTVREVENGPLVILAGNHTAQALGAHGPGPCGITVRVGNEERACAVCQGQEWDPAARCEVVTCDDATARRVNLVDNRSAELGTYDYDALAELFEGLGDDYDGTSYTEKDIAEIAELVAMPQEDVKGRPAPAADDDEQDEDQAEDDEESSETFHPIISIRIPHGVFDRWREALDRHPGQDDAVKLLGLLDEVEAARKARATG